MLKQAIQQKQVIKGKKNGMIVVLLSSISAQSRDTLQTRA